MNPPQPNFYNPQQQQQNWGGPAPPMTSAVPGQVPFQNGNQNQQGANVSYFLEGFSRCIGTHLQSFSSL